MFSVKALYHRFKAWQVCPAGYQVVKQPQHCNNCGHDYEGRFCPQCGQRATAGRITWRVVRQGVMDVWGLGGRSLPYSLWQLLWRPGYFISDYINGKWQSSFPPIKMLVLVTVFVVLIGRIIYPDYWNVMVDEESMAITSTGWQYYIDYVSLWMNYHLEWAFLFVFSLMILPTWLVFRRSPRNPRHTLPQGFFIQVFATTQFILWLFLLSSCAKLMGVDSDCSAGSSQYEDLAVVGSLCLIPVIVVVDYRQLFGYGWWGTVWRLMVVVVSIVVAADLLATLVMINKIDVNSLRMLKLVLFASILVLFAIVLLLVTDAINRRLWSVKGWLRPLMAPLVLVCIVVILGIYIETIDRGFWVGLFSFWDE